MIRKLKFSEIKHDQEFYAVEDYVGNEEMMFMKIAPMPILTAPPIRTACTSCGAFLDEWVNAVEVSDLSQVHFCPDDEVFILHQSSEICG